MAYGTANVDVIQSSTAGTPVQFNDGNGTQVGTLCRAWVNFNGLSGASPVIRASFNVSSVVRSATGDYTVNFTNALSDSNYSVCGSCLGGSSSGSNYVLFGGKNANTTNTQTTSAVQITTAYVASTGGVGGLIDHPVISVSVFR